VAIIRLDNQPVIATLALHKPKPVQHIIDEILLQAERIWEGVEHPDFSIEIAWVNGHSGGQGMRWSTWWIRRQPRRQPWG